MKVKDLIKQLKALDEYQEVLFSSDEEGNNLYIDAEVSLTELDGSDKPEIVIIIYPTKLYE